MDGDEIPEAVLELEIGDWLYMLVLHYYNGTVYGHIFSDSDMRNLKKDGTFNLTMWWGTWGSGKLQFSAGIFKTHESSKIDTYVSPTRYYINYELVSEEEWNLFDSEQNQKEDADWYDFNNANIDKLLTTIPVSPETGDNSVIYASIALASMAVIFMIIKKAYKQNE